MQEIMTIKCPRNYMKLYPPPTFEDWFDSHQYEWRHKNSTFRERPSKELTETYQKAIARHLKWQGTLIKTFMVNNNGHKKR